MTAEYKVVFAAEIERRSRLLAPGSLVWKCQKPSEQDEYQRRYNSENARLAGLSPADLEAELAWTQPGSHRA